MNKGKVCVLVLALLALLAGTAQAEMYVEGYLGGNFAGNASNMATGTYDLLLPPTDVNFPGHIDPAFLGGLKLGAWFERSGVLSGINFPAWMKYFGFYMDFCYHRLDFPKRGSNITVSGKVGTFTAPTIDYSEGGAATLAFMFAARYGFFPNQDVPFGRLQAYAGVGPAIMWTWQQPTVFFPTAHVSRNTLKPDSVSTANVALAVEAGLRWMCLKNVSLDLSFKYRYTQPTYAYSGRINYAHPNFSLFPSVNLRLEPPLNLFSVQLGAAYHF